MERILINLKENKWIHFAVIILIGLLLSVPLIFTQIYNSHDGNIHFLRLVGTVDIMKIGQFPALINQNYCNGAGYAINLFYAPLVTYIPLIIKLFTPSYMSALKIFGGLCIILSGFTMYHLTYSITKKRSIALFAAIIYIVAPYKLANVYKRFAMGEFTALVFIPLVFLGLYNLFEQDGKKHYYIAVGTIALALSHSVSTIYTAVFCILYILFNIKKLKNIDIIKKCFINFIFIVLVTMLFHLPLLEATKATSYGITNNESMRTNGEFAQDNTVKLLEFIKYNSERKEGFEVTVVIGIATITLFISSCFLGKFVDKEYKNFYIINIIFTIFSLFMATYLFPWKIMPDIVCELQYPWRMVGFATMFLSFVCGINLYNLLKIISKKDTIKLLIGIVIILMMILEAFNVLRYFYVKDRSIDQKYEERILSNPKITHMQINREYMPLKALKLQSTYVAKREDKALVLEGNVKITEENKENLKDIIKIKDGKKGDIIEFPYYYYVGYEITLNDKEKTKPIESENGYISYKLENDIDDGIIKVEYKGTTIQKVSYIISFVGLVLFIIYIVYEKKKNGEKND